MDETMLNATIGTYLIVSGKICFSPWLSWWQDGNVSRNVKNVLRCTACNCQTLVLWVRPFCVWVPAHIRENLPQTDPHFDWPCFLHHNGDIECEFSCFAQMWFFFNTPFFIIVEKPWSMNSSSKACNFYRSSYRWKLNLERTHQPCLQNITHFLPVLCCLTSFGYHRFTKKQYEKNNWGSYVIPAFSLSVSHPERVRKEQISISKYKGIGLLFTRLMRGLLKVSHAPLTMFPPLRFLSNLQIKGEMSKYLWISFAALVCWRLKTSSFL